MSLLRSLAKSLEISDLQNGAFICH